MAILGGSPLGLISTTSGSLNGSTTFNADFERRGRVANYNSVSMNIYPPETKGDRGKGNSLFSGQRIVRAFPDSALFKDSAQPGAEWGNNEEIRFNPSSKKDTKFIATKPSKLHSNNVYDTSLVNIVRTLQNTNAQLKMADFAYLKDVGVYSNNRLMIARRFVNGIYDNIFRKISGDGGDVGPLATVISWMPQDTFPVQITFGEKWEDAAGTFKDILDQIGSDISSKFQNTGGVVESVGGALPLPGFTEVFQRYFLQNIGVLDKNAPMIPSGNPNLIKEAKQRVTVGYDTAGSGLECEVTVQMTCEYEQKFISGLDPTIVWMDIIGNVLRFGTSPSVKYGLSSGFAATVKNALNDPMGFIVSVITKIREALGSVMDNIKTELRKKYEEAKELMKAQADKKNSETQETAADIAARAKKGGDVIISKIRGFLSAAVKGMAYKYRVKIQGVVHALSGMPSTPWHITVGNPLRPIFCAGDMLTQSVSLELGPNLAFNDLPSSIKITFQLKNARPWGLQEIMAKFNSGYVRSVDVQKTFQETNVIDKGDASKQRSEPPGRFPFEDNSFYEAEAEGSSSGSSGSSGLSSGVAGNPGGETAAEKAAREDREKKEAADKAAKEAADRAALEAKKTAEENERLRLKKEQEDALEAEKLKRLEEQEKAGKSISQTEEGKSELTEEEKANAENLTKELKVTKVIEDKLPKDAVFNTDGPVNVLSEDTGGTADTGVQQKILDNLRAAGGLSAQAKFEP